MGLEEQQRAMSLGSLNPKNEPDVELLWTYPTNLIVRLAKRLKQDNFTSARSIKLIIVECYLHNLSDIKNGNSPLRIRMEMNIANLFWAGMQT